MTSAELHDFTALIASQKQTIHELQSRLSLGIIGKTQFMLMLQERIDRQDYDKIIFTERRCKESMNLLIRELPIIRPLYDLDKLPPNPQLPERLLSSLVEEQ